MGKTAKYVLNLIDAILGAGEREKCFDWAQGDPSPSTKRTRRLPFDSVWESRKLIIEIDEDQHTQVTPFFDKPHKLTVSGVHRGEQRAIYDARKRTAAAKNGYQVVAITWPRKKRQRPLEDAGELRKLLGEAGLGAPRAATRGRAQRSGTGAFARGHARVSRPDWRPRSRRRPRSRGESEGEKGVELATKIKRGPARSIRTKQNKNR